MTKVESFILIFDIPRKSQTLKRQVNRKLHQIKAKMLQHSVWKSRNLADLVKIASKIKKEGGEVTILKEDVIFY
jgi:CRISPR-associated endonuclease Cas2